MLSAWSDNSDIPRHKPLEGDMKTDVLIIGGGMAGVLCAYLLKEAGIDYALVEAENICGGITKNTTAKITSQHGFIYDKLLKEFGENGARAYFEINEIALNKYRELAKNIDCDFEERDNLVYSLDDRDKVERELNALKKIGYRASFSDNLPLPFKTAGAVRFKNQAQFNPLKFISGISGDLNIFEQTKVKELIGNVAVTERGKIFADRIIVATHFPLINKHGSYFIKMYQHRSYVLALENAPSIDAMYVDGADNGMSFRSYKNLLLIGGGDHRTGKDGGAWGELEDFKNKYCPKAQERYRWATQDCMTLDGVPYIGRYSKNTDDLYVSTGFNKWGMTSSMVSAMILSDMLKGIENPYAWVFSPLRSAMKPQLFSNAFEATMGMLTPTTKRCPHMGCALKWNKYEHTWDCTCHGSRFTREGKLIDNPATGDLK